MPNGTYGGVRGWKTKVGRKLFRFPPTRFIYNKVCLFPGGWDASAAFIPFD